MAALAAVVLLVFASTACPRQTMVPIAAKIPPPPPPAPQASLTVSPSEAKEGSQVTLTWVTANASSVEIDGIGSVEANGSRSITALGKRMNAGPLDTVTTYHLVASGPGGQTQASAQVHVTGPRIATSAEPPPVELDGARIPRDGTVKHPYIPPVESGLKALKGNVTPDTGYDLYSCVLFTDAPPPAERQKYLNLIKAFQDKLPLLSTIEQPSNPTTPSTSIAVDALPREKLNVVFIPVLPDFNEDIKTADPEHILKNYNHPRARRVMRSIPGRTSDQGIFILSVRQFPQPEHVIEGDYLLQDLSNRVVNADLAYKWVQIFTDQVKTQEFWKAQHPLQKLLLDVRSAIQILSDCPPALKLASLFSGQ